MYKKIKKLKKRLDILVGFCYNISEGEKGIQI